MKKIVTISEYENLSMVHILKHKTVDLFKGLDHCDCDFHELISN